MKRIIIITVFFAFSHNFLVAQIADSMFLEFQNFTEEINEEYAAFKDAIWKEFEAMKPLKNYEKPKPVTPPKVLPEEIPEEPKPVAPKPIVVAPKPKIPLPVDDFSERRTANFRNKLKQILVNSSNTVKVNFYGAKFTLYYNDIDFDLSTVSEKSITNSYQNLMDKSEDMDNIVAQLVEYACLMQLNDYAFMTLVHTSALEMLKNQNKANLFTWLVMNMNKYDCKLAYNSDVGQLYIIIPSVATMFGLPYFEMNGKKYYILPPNKDAADKLPEKFSTYVDNPLESDKIIDFNFTKAPRINLKFADTERSMPNINKEFDLIYNVNYVEMLKDMPVLEHEYYFYIPMSSKTFEDIKSKFQPMLSGKSELEKVKFILNFVQQGFPYKYDIDNFGRKEQPLAPEEVLCYSHCDCEDHAALFAYLVATLTDCEVVGVLYSDHATTAVKFKHARPNGYYLPAPYSDYVLCESTISNGTAPIGVVGVQYVGVAPQKVFKIDKNIIRKGLGL